MEFENLQIEVPTHEDPSQSQLFGIKIYEKKYHNKTKDFVVGFDPKSKEFVDRKARRAKRFGIQNESNTDSEKENDTDVSNFNEIDIDNLKWPPVPEEAKAEIRHDAILVYGVNDMSTQDVFEYFSLYGPEMLEWIDDYSCNVVWDGDKFVRQAMDTMSKTYTMLSRIKKGNTENSSISHVTIKDEEEEVECTSNEILIEDEEITPKDIWRVAIPWKSNQLFLRPATIKDKKLPGAAQRSEYYLKYGKSSNKPGTNGLISKSRKRKLEKLQKTANDRFKTDEPDVKLVDVEDVKREGGDYKMEVDDEPQIKRLNIHNDTPKQMTMIADKEELREKLGPKYNTSRVQDRLGEPLLRSDGENSSDDDERKEGKDVFQRIGGGVHDRLGNKKNTRTKFQNDKDARDDIESSRKTNQRKKFSKYGYEDENGIYHDIYRADDDYNTTKYRSDEDNDDHYKDSEYRRRDKTKYYKNISSKDLRERVRNRNKEIPINETNDLRNKLRSKRVDRQEIKKEESPDRPNLCIEIKQEVSDVEMEESGDENFEF